MSKSKIKRIDYISKISLIDGQSIPSYSSKPVEADFVKSYHNTLVLLSRVPDSAKNLMLFLVEKMSDDNVIHSDVYTRENFTKHTYYGLLKEFRLLVNDDKSRYFGMDANKLAVSKTYKKPTITAAFQTLKKHNMLLLISRGIYRVNPEFFYRKSEAERMKSIKMTLEFKAGVKHVGFGVDTEYI